MHLFITFTGQLNNCTWLNKEFKIVTREIKVHNVKIYIYIYINTGRRYFINKKVDCDSSYVVYLATCLRWQGQYVGKSVTKFKIRHSNHKQEIKWKKGGLGKHFGGSRACTYKDASFTIIEQVEIGNRALLAKREKHWQHQLRAFEDNGGNGMCIKKEDE